MAWEPLAPGSKTQKDASEPTKAAPAKSGGGWKPLAGSTAKPAGSKEPKKRDPQKELDTAIRKLERLEASGQLKGKDKSTLQALRTAYTVSASAPTREAATQSLGVPEPVQKGLGKALDIVGRPGQAVMSGVAEAAKPGDAPGAMLSAMKAGLLGRRRDTATDVVENITSTGPNDPGYRLTGPAAFATNLTGAVATDPFTTLTFGTSGAARQGLRVTGEVLGPARAAEVAAKGTRVLSDVERAAVAAKTTPKVLKALDKGAQGGVKQFGATLPGLTSKNVRTVAEASKLAPLARKVGASAPAAALAEAFIPRAAVKAKYGVKNADAINEARIAYRAGQNIDIEDDLLRLAKAVRDSGATPDELVDLGRTLDVGGASLAGPINQRLVPLRDELSRIRTAFTEAQIDAGVLAEDALHITDEYLPRFLTDAGKKFFGVSDAAVTPVRTGTKPLGAAESKSLSARTYGKESAAADLTDEAGAPLFETNPVKAIARRKVEAAQDVATRGFVTNLETNLKHRETGESLFRRVEEQTITLDDGSKLTRSTPHPKDWVEVDAGRAGKFMAPKEIRDEVQKVIAMTVNDAGLKRTIDMFDKWQALWKSYATVPLPFGQGFHMRNGMGNMVLNMLAGDVTIADYAQAFKMQRAMSRGKKAGGVLAGGRGRVLGALTNDERAILQEARREGALGTNFYDVDTAGSILGKDLGGRTGKFNVNPLNIDNAVIRLGRTVGSGIEDNAKLAHFIAKRRVLGDSKAAAASVRKYLFDYSDLTATEKNVFKRANSFYTFTRKNIPVQIEAALKTPGKFSRFDHLREALSASAPDTGGLEPDYLLRSAGIPLPQGLTDALAKVPGLDFEKGKPAMLDLGQLHPAGNVVDQLTPVLNLGAELIPGMEKYRNEEGFAAALGEALQNTFVGGPAGAVMAGAEVALGKTMFSGRRLQGDTDTPHALVPVFGDKIDKGKLHFIEQNLPLLAKISSTIPRGERAAQGAGRRRLSTATGLKVTQLNEATRDSEALRRLDVIADFISRLKEAGVKVPGSR